MRRWWKRVGTFLRLLWFVPICRFCGVRQSVFVSQPPMPLCPSCMTRLNDERERLCLTCAMPYLKCLCMPPLLHKAGCRGLVKLSEYHAGRATVNTRLILRAKTHKDIDLFDFWAADLALPTLRALQSCGVDEALSDVIVTYIPRSAATVWILGHDQAKVLACALSRQMNLPFAKTLSRAFGGTQQKKLTQQQRVRQAQQVYALTSGADVRGKTVLLVDDICTTGATLAACTERLLAGGAVCVVGVCLGMTEKEKN